MKANDLNWMANGEMLSPSLLLHPLFHRPDFTQMVRLVTDAKPTLIIPGPEEVAVVYTFLFLLATGSPVVSTPTPTLPIQLAVDFLSKATNLSQSQLGSIWQIAIQHSSSNTATDSQANMSTMDQPSFYKALKLISIAQMNPNIPLSSINDLTRPSPLPQFQGVDSYFTTVELDMIRASFSACQPAPFGYSQIMCITSNAAKDLFMKSGLPVHTLGKIWELLYLKPFITSGDEVPKMDVIQFSVAMYYIYRQKQGILPNIPSTVFPGLLESIKRREDSNARSAPLNRTLSNAKVGKAPLSTPSASMFSIPDLIGNEAVSGDWVISEEDQNSFSKHFERLDVERAGVLTGDKVYAFFLKSKLPSDVLAKIWELAHISKSGAMTLEEFIMAMHLVKLALAGSELPLTLPPQFAAPSSRKASVSSSIRPISSSFSNIFGSSTDTTTAAPSKRPESAVFAPLYSTASAVASMPYSPVKQQSTVSVVFPEMASTPSGISILDHRKQDVAALRKQTVDIQSALSNLRPQAQQNNVKSELDEVMRQKVEAVAELEKTRALYEAETKAVAEAQIQLHREIKALEDIKEEREKVMSLLVFATREKEGLEGQLGQVRDELSSVRQSMGQITLNTKGIQAETERIRQNIDQQLKFLEMNQLLLQQTRDEYSAAVKARDEVADNCEQKSLQAQTVQKLIEDTQKSVSGMGLSPVEGGASITTVTTTDIGNGQMAGEDDDPFLSMRNSTERSTVDFQPHADAMNDIDRFTSAFPADPSGDPTALEEEDPFASFRGDQVLKPVEPALSPSKSASPTFSVAKSVISEHDSPAMASPPLPPRTTKPNRSTSNLDSVFVNPTPGKKPPAPLPPKIALRSVDYGQVSLTMADQSLTTEAAKAPFPARDVFNVNPPESLIYMGGESKDPITEPLVSGSTQNAPISPVKTDTTSFVSAPSEFSGHGISENFAVTHSPVLSTSNISFPPAPLAQLEPASVAGNVTPTISEANLFASMSIEGPPKTLNRKPALNFSVDFAASGAKSPVGKSALTTTKEEWDDAFNVNAWDSVSPATVESVSILPPEERKESEVVSISDDFVKIPSPTPGDAVRDVVASADWLTVSDSALQQLMALGFTKEKGEEALDRYDNDLEKATNFLLDNTENQ